MEYGMRLHIIGCFTICYFIYVYTHFRLQEDSRGNRAPKEVPQYVLEAALEGSGPLPNIIVTEPRRISAAGASVYIISCIFI